MCMLPFVVGVTEEDYHVRAYLSNPSALRDSKRRPYVTVRPKQRRTYAADIQNTKLLPKVNGGALCNNIHKLNYSSIVLSNQLSTEFR